MALIALAMAVALLVVIGVFVLPTKHQSRRSTGATLTPITLPKAVVASVPPPLGVPGQWELRLDSTFGGQPLNVAIWRPGWFGTGVTDPINSSELACYSSHNVELVGSGVASLTLSETPSRCADGARPYTGAIMSTNPYDGRATGGFEYRYGVLEARVFFPAQGALFANWPAVTTLGQSWPDDGEDDILEALTGEACFAWHSSTTAPGFAGCDSNIRPGWHTIAANWERGRVTWYYDGEVAGELTSGVTSKPMYIAIVNTVASSERSLIHPDTMRVAYVRVWQKA